MSDDSGRRWTGGLSAAERVEAVALTVDEPRTANWIATDAEIAHETATKYLTRLTDEGKLNAESHGHSPRTSLTLSVSTSQRCVSSTTTTLPTNSPRVSKR